MLSLLYWTRLESEPAIGKDRNPKAPYAIKLSTMTLSSSKAQCILRNMPLSQFNNEISTVGSSHNLSIEIYFHMKPVVSNVMNTIIKSFGHLTKA